MLAKLPIISSAITYSDLQYVFLHALDKSISERFRVGLSELVQSRYIYLTNSGLSSFYIILKILKDSSQKTEVILPAYTAGSLVTAVIKAGLKLVLCDISLEDFNLNTDFLLKVISRNTLAIVAVHMFGIPIKDIKGLREKIPPDIFLIEDCAQAMGSKIAEKQVGNFSEISFFSFNRGKNLSVCGGGCIATSSEELSERIGRGYKLCVRDYGIFKILTIPLKTLAISLASNPFVYGWGYSLISQFKEKAPPKDFSVNKINNFHSGLGLRLLQNIDVFSHKRYENGMFLISSLKDVKGLVLPQILKDSQPVFNRFPILFEDLNRRDRVQKKLWQGGIESSRMYLAPLHHMFNSGYTKNEFPNANYLAERLLTLPVYPSLRHEVLLRMIDIIKRT